MGDGVRWAFSDESERAATVLFGLVVVAPADAADLRAELRRLLLPGQRRLHTSDESCRRRRHLLDAVGRLDGVHATVLRVRRPKGLSHLGARHLVVGAAAGIAIRNEVAFWTLDDVPPGVRSRDYVTIERARERYSSPTKLVFDHRRSHTEPLLWIADAVCWAVGAGAEWRRRVQAITAVVDVRP